MTDEKSDRLLVRSDYLTRCGWCGTPYSPDWVGTQTGRLFCSSECQSAANAGKQQWAGGFAIGIGAVMLIIPEPAVILGGLWFLLMGFCVLAQGIEGRSYRDRKDKYRNTQLLVCEYCNHINTPDVVVCDNCGASLIGSDFALDPWPEWFVPPPKLRRVRGPCRNCGEPFEYPILSADGKHRCPRCAKPVG